MKIVKLISFTLVGLLLASCGGGGNPADDPVHFTHVEIQFDTVDESNKVTKDTFKNSISAKLESYTDFKDNKTNCQKIETNSSELHSDVLFDFGRAEITEKYVQASGSDLAKSSYQYDHFDRQISNGVETKTKEIGKRSEVKADVMVYGLCHRVIDKRDKTYKDSTQTWDDPVVDGKGLYVSLFYNANEYADKIAQMNNPSFYIKNNNVFILEGVEPKSDCNVHHKYQWTFNEKTIVHYETYDLIGLAYPNFGRIIDTYSFDNVSIEVPDISDYTKIS